jgi:HAD superfamily hydrolase (TIGR01549 family)
MRTTRENLMQAILFDLDDTLLGNDMDRFIPAYFSALHSYMAEVPDGLRVLQHLWAATQETMQSADTTRTVQQKMWQALERLSGVRAELIAPRFEAFYATRFAALQPATETRPVARELVAHCLEQGMQVVVATNPLFPRTAIEERLRWAGLPVNEWPFALVTTYEEMVATKPHAAYYEQILAKIGRKPHECLMVGDDWVNDIAPARALGMAVWWVPPGERGESADVACGPLESLLDRLRNGNQTAFTNSSTS